MSPIDRVVHYGAISRLLHWTMVAMVAVAWTLGMFGSEVFDSRSASRAGEATGLNVHVWAGLAVLMIAALRFPWRITHPPPPPESNEFGRWLISWTDPAARVTHYVLYLLLFAVPIAGIVLQFSRGQPLSVFGLVEIPPLFSANSRLAHNLEELHEILANALIIIALFHSTAALTHHIVFRDNTLVRMAPWLRRQNRRSDVNG